MFIRIQRDNARPDQARGPPWPNPDHVAGIAPLKKVQSVKAGHAGDSRNQEGQSVGEFEELFGEYHPSFLPPEILFDTVSTATGPPDQALAAAGNRGDTQ